MPPFSSLLYICTLHALSTRLFPYNLFIFNNFLQLLLYRRVGIILSTYSYPNNRALSTAGEVFHGSGDGRHNNLRVLLLHRLDDVDETVKRHYATCMESMARTDNNSADQSSHAQYLPELIYSSIVKEISALSVINFL